MKKAKNHIDIDLPNLAFSIKEVFGQLEHLNKNETEILETLLDDNTIKALEEIEDSRESVSYEEYFKDVLPTSNEDSTYKKIPKVAWFFKQEHQLYINDLVDLLP